MLRTAGSARRRHGMRQPLRTVSVRRSNKRPANIPSCKRIPVERTPWQTNAPGEQTPPVNIRPQTNASAARSQRRRSFDRSSDGGRSRSSVARMPEDAFRPQPARSSDRIRRAGRRPRRPAPQHRRVPRPAAACRARAPAARSVWAADARPGCRYTSGRCTRATRY